MNMRIVGLFGLALVLASCATPPKSEKAQSMPAITKPPPMVQTRWPFYKPTQYLHIEKFDIHILGTESVSPWMMKESYVLISNMVAALKHPEDQRRFRGHQAFIITDVDPDLTQIGSIPGHRNTGGNGFSLFNEALVCTKAVDTIRPNNPPEYRGWNTPVHEFGHSIEITLGLQSRSNTLFKEKVKSYNSKNAREYFAWATQKWFGCDHVPGRGRAAMPDWEYAYLSDVFDESNQWVPFNDPRN